MYNNLWKKQTLICLLLLSKAYTLSGIIISSTVNVREKASFKSKIIGVVKKGEVVENIRRDGRWFCLDRNKYIPKIAVLTEKNAFKYVRRQLINKIIKYNKNIRNLYRYYLTLRHITQNKENVLELIDKKFGDNTILVAALCLYYEDKNTGLLFLKSAIKYKNRDMKAKWYLSYINNGYWDNILDINVKLKLPLLILLLS